MTGSATASSIALDAATTPTYGMGMESQRSKNFRERDATGDAKDYNRNTSAKARALLTLVPEHLFRTRYLQMTVRDLEKAGAEKIGRSAFRAEWGLVQYLHSHIETVVQMWQAGGFRIQNLTNLSAQTVAPEGDTVPLSVQNSSAESSPTSPFRFPKNGGPTHARQSRLPSRDVRNKACSFSQPTGRDLE
jgi:hypothetical protein